MLGYVRPNVVIKALQQIYKTPLYIDAKVLVKPNWQGWIELVNVANENELQKHEFEQDFDIDNLNTSEKIIEGSFGNTLIQNILDLEQIVDDNSKSLSLAPGEGFWPLGIICDKHSKEYNSSTLFFGHARWTFQSPYQNKIQVELISVNI